MNWEYNILDHQKYQSETYRCLNYSGQEGWEAVFVLPTGAIVLKRPIPEAKDTESFKSA